MVNPDEYIVNVYYFDGEEQKIVLPIKNRKMPSLNEIIYHTRGLKEIEKIISEGGRVIFSVTNLDFDNKEE